MKIKQNLCTERAILIDSTAENIWDVLTNPHKINLYLFGSLARTDWKVGSLVTFSRDVQGKHYVDKGEIIERTSNKFLKFTYWSSQEGYEDIPENYSVISYTLEKENVKSIKLIYRREKIPMVFEHKNQEKYLPGMLDNIKRIAEQK